MDRWYQWYLGQETGLFVQSCRFRISWFDAFNTSDSMEDPATKRFPKATIFPAPRLSKGAAFVFTRCAP
jgi:hypothetical protein